MVFPVSHAAVAVSEIQEEVRKKALLLGPKHQTFLRGYEKISTMKAAERAGVPIPKTWYPHEEEGGINEVASAISNWPVLVKPSVGAGARGIVWCHSAADLVREFSRIEQEFGVCLVQDFVPPGKLQYKVDMLVDQEQRMLAGIVYGKTRMYPPNGGSSVLNVSANRPDILGFAYRMLVHLKWSGFCDFDFVDDPRDGIPKFIEINPRFPESLRMGTSVGIDFPMIMARLAKGDPIEPVLGYPIGHYLRFLPGDLLWFLRVDNKQRFSTWPSWFKFFGKDMTYQLSSWKDPGPAVGYILENIVMMINSSFWKERFRA